jgi:hypothetical protein
MAKKRSVREQVISGLRIGGLIVLSFAFFAAMVVGASLITGREATPSIEHRSLGVFALCVLAGILFFTVHRWTEWLIGIFGYCLLRFFGALLFGPYLKKPVSRIEVAGWMLYLIVAILLTMRHVHRHPKRFEKIGLVGFVLSVPFALTLSSYKPLLLGLLCLAFGELSEMLRRRMHRHHLGKDRPLAPA